MKKALKLFEIYYKRAKELKDKANTVFYIPIMECSMNCRRNINKIISNKIAIDVTDVMLGVITQNELDEKMKIYEVIRQSLDYRIG